MGKMSFWDVIAQFKSELSAESRRISACIATICFTALVIAFTFLSAAQSENPGAIIGAIVISLVVAVFLFSAILLLITETRANNVNREILKQLIDSPSTDAEESLFCRYYLARIAYTILWTVKNPRSYMLHPDSDNCRKQHAVERTRTTLSLWQLLSSSYPDVHAITICSTSEKKTFVLHINSAESFTLTILHHIDVDHQYMEYLPIEIKFGDDYLKEVVDTLDIENITEYYETDLINWQDARSISKFYHAALPEHEFSIA